MRQFALSLLLVLSFTAAFAQATLEEVIYLKDGSVLRGTIIEEVPGKSYKIQLLGGSIFNVELADVVKLTKEPVHGTEPKRSKGDYHVSSKNDTVPRVFTPRKRGYFFQSQLLLENVQGGVRIINGYRFGRFGMLGIGVGFDVVLGSPVEGRNNSYEYEQLHGVYLPIFLHYSGDILKKRITPFYAIELGYALAANGMGTSVEEDAIGGTQWDDDVRGGAMGGLGIGVKFHTKRRVHFSLLLNVNFKNLSFREYYYSYDSNGSPYYSGTTNRNTTLVFPGIRFGIGF